MFSKFQKAEINVCPTQEYLKLVASLFWIQTYLADIQTDYCVMYKFQLPTPKPNYFINHFIITVRCLLELSVF